MDEMDYQNREDQMLLDDEIEQATKDIYSLGAPLTQIDIQNRIWCKIIQKERLREESKRRQLLGITHQ